MADIEFADDIALLANPAIDAQTLLQTVEEIVASVGLKMEVSGLRKAIKIRLFTALIE